MRIEDLAAPRQTSAALQAIAYAETQPVQLARDEVLDAASNQTGLSDFGDMDFVERLDVMLQSAREDVGLNALGRKLFYDDMVRYAANRLRVEDLIRANPEILRIEIERPIIIVGMPRTGTTHLVNLIASDERLRSLPYWESLTPVPPPGQPDTRLEQAEAGWAALDQILPMQKNVHELSPTHVHEEIELQGIDFSSYIIEWISRPFRWRDYYLAHDQTPQYRYMRKVLQVLTWLRGPRRWVLKSPQHMEQLGPLTATFPDATIVVTHRDPVAVIASCVTMNAYIDRLRRKEVEPVRVADYWVDRIERMMRACVRDRHILPAERSEHVMFHDFMRDQMRAVRRIYAMAQLDLPESVEASLHGYIESHRRDRHGQLSYDLDRDFGLKPAALREQFGFYYEAFGVPAEA
jgi:hypothetical protein